MALSTPALAFLALEFLVVQGLLTVLPALVSVEFTVRAVPLLAL